MSNIQVNSGDSVSLTGVTTTQNTVKISEGAVNVSIKGIQGGDAHFTFTQAAPSDTWTIEHNLGKKASVTVVDSADSVVYGDVDYTDLNNLTITFDGAFSGKAYLN